MRDYGKKSSSTAVKKYADGGEVSDKEVGLSRSAGEGGGFWDRIKAGNIDDPNSRAYREYGAGRGKAEKEMDSFDAEVKATKTAAAPTAVKDAPKLEDVSVDTPAYGEDAPTSADVLPQKTRAERDMPGASGVTVKSTTVKPAKMDSPSVAPVKASGASGGGFAGGLSSGLKTGMRTAEAMRNRDASNASGESQKTRAQRDAPGASGESESLFDTTKRFFSSGPKSSAPVRGQGMANGGVVGGGRDYGKKG